MILQLIAYFYDFANADALGCASVCDKLVTESFSSFLPLHNSLFHPLTDFYCFLLSPNQKLSPISRQEDFHLSSQVMEDAHSPPRLRVIGTLSNRFSNLKSISSLVLIARVLILEYCWWDLKLEYYQFWTTYNLTARSHQFLKEFSCKGDSKMSAEKKCSVWWNIKVDQHIRHNSTDIVKTNYRWY